MPIFEIEQNGKVFEVDAPDIQTAASSLGGQQQQPWPTQTPIPLSPHERQQGRAAAGAQGMTFRFADEITGGMSALSAGLKGQPMGAAYEKARDEFRSAEKRYAGENPGSAAGLNILGGAPYAMASGGMTAASTLAGRMGQGAAVGGATGATIGFGSGEGGFQERAKNAAAVGVPSALLGGAAPALVEGAYGAGRHIASQIRGGAPAPTAEALKGASRAAYQTAENEGVIIAKDSFKRAVSEIQQELADEGIDATLHPKALAAFNRLAAVDENLTLKGAEQLRRVVAGAAKSIEPDERRMAAIIRDRLDDYVSNLESADLVGGNAAKATEALKEARGLWSKASKGELVDDLVERARTRTSQFSGSGFENAIRTEFRQLAMNEKRMRRFSKPEQDVIKAVVRGGPVTNALRMLGKFAPTGVVSGGIGAGLGYGVAGPAGAVALPAMGAAARVGATALTERNARLASEFMRRGGPATTEPLGFAQPGFDQRSIGLLQALLLGRMPQPVNQPR